MPRSTYHVLKRTGRVSLIETANPWSGVAYAVRKDGVRIWAGNDLVEAESSFYEAAANGAGVPRTISGSNLDG